MVLSSLPPLLLLVLQLAPAPPDSARPRAAAPCVERWDLGLRPPAASLEPLARTATLAGFGALHPRVVTHPTDDALLTACGRVPAVLAERLRADRPSLLGGLEPLPVTAAALRNSAYPRTALDGGLWPGRGASVVLSGGVRGSWGPLTAQIAPAAYYQQNLDFPIATVRVPGFSPFVDFGHPTSVDLPQRFGTDAFWTIDPGQSFVRVQGFGAAVGVSTENVTIGPAIRNPLLLSAAASGFPHVFVGTAAPVWIGIGRAEVHAILGRLSESDYFDGTPGNDRRALGALVLSIRPRGLEGLELGAARVYEQTIPPGGLEAGDYLNAIVDLPFARTGGNKPGNALASLFGRWAFPRVGFEAYAEWGRDDYNWTFEDFLKEPDHSQAYTIGFQKVMVSPDQWIRFVGELSHLEAPIPLRSGAGAVSFYTHTIVRQGHTHRGQPLGAPIGPGSSAEYLGVDVLRRRIAAGIFGERIRHDADAYYATYARYYGIHGHDVELTAGLWGSYVIGDLLARGAVTVAHRYNRNFVGLETGEFTSLHSEDNLGLELSLSWWPGSSRGTTPASRPRTAPARRP